MKRKRIEIRKVLLMLPFLIWPILAGAFYYLGGGQQKDLNKSQGSKAGINVSLPDAKFASDTLAGKMSIYDQQQQTGFGVDSALTDDDELGKRLGFSGLTEDPKVVAIHQRLALLNTEMAKGFEQPTTHTNKSQGGLAVSTPEVEKLERLMQSMQHNGEDVEMKQLSEILDRIQEINDPDLARLKLKAAPGNKVEIDSMFKAIPAVIDGHQKAVQGSVVKLKLLDTLSLAGYLLPKGYNVYALGSFSNQRLQLEIKNIRIGNSIVPVRLTVFDQNDAMVGINAPEALLGDAIRGGGADAVGSFGMMGMDLTTQLAGAGLDAAKGLLTKKLKRIRQPLKDGYLVLLRLEKR